jgi:exonuclease III
LNDYRERIVVEGGIEGDWTFTPVTEDIRTSLDVLTEGGFCENVAERLPPLERWTLYHTRGPQERHLCQLDYVLVSGGWAQKNATRLPQIITRGQPWRTPFPPGQSPERWPRIGWDRPKASDHCPVVMELDVL